MRLALGSIIICKAPFSSYFVNERAELQPLNRPLRNVPKTLKMIYHLLCYQELHLSGFGLSKAVINEAIGEDKSMPDTRH